MKAVCVSCFNYYNNRIKYVEQILKKEGYNVYYITSDFDHIDKIRYTVERSNTIQIHVNPYYKNLSVQRLLSHYFLLSIPFRIWRKLRDNNINAADIIITQCKLYQEKINYVLNKTKTYTLYLTKEESKIQSAPIIDPNIINICYLGSINNIIDMSSISQLLANINKIKPVVLHIIGDGENREKFIENVKSSGVNVIFYGKIYDEQKKREIFDKCSFGINMMKKTVCVGLTMKSIDYFQAGLPILNNIQVDTEQLVKEYNIGFNVRDKNVESVAVRIANVDIKELMEMRENTRRVFEKLFSLEAFNKRLVDVIKEMSIYEKRL